MHENRRRFLVQMLGLLGAGNLPVHAASTLKFGVVPYLTARRLATLYEPARACFERLVAHPVQISSAPDYAAHLERLRSHEYDLVADSLPLARLAQREHGYLPLARTRVPLQPILVVAADSPLKTVDQLRGGAIAVSDRLAALTLIGLRFLRDNNLRPNSDVTIKVAGSHVNAIQRVMTGDVMAAVISRTTLKQIDPQLAGKVRLLRELPQALSAVVYAASPAFAAQFDALKQGLLSFAETDPDGRAFIANLGHQGLLPVGRELAEVDGLVAEFYRQLTYAE
ncbi:MAG: phosphate/phosphite/phosphonate ABC transporter substrate-binding protein [Azonexus sp.]|nr:phosphate/phosphite/phosphonate ABC transporter substrate-binding protein [Azonexus sp.]